LPKKSTTNSFPKTFQIYHKNKRPSQQIQTNSVTKTTPKSPSWTPSRRATTPQSRWNPALTFTSRFSKTGAIVFFSVAIAESLGVSEEKENYKIVCSSVSFRCELK
jgi:hypothetical protein